MSELIDNTRQRKELLKHMILQLHKGEAPEAVRNQLIRVMGQVPYDTVVEVEQELISEGLPLEEVLKMCDVHSRALKGQISQAGAKPVPPGHPVHTFKEENKALQWEIVATRKLFEDVKNPDCEKPMDKLIDGLRRHFHSLADIEKHYRRKENLLFPFLEKHGITGPPAVMWGKHDQTRELLKTAIEALPILENSDSSEVSAVIDLVLNPALDSIEEMIGKEEQILLPMCMDTLTDEEWYQIYTQSIEVGFCLYDPSIDWKPEGITAPMTAKVDLGRIQLPSGSFTVPELEAILNTIPFDLTFVDANDTVRYFTQGRERIFERNRAILGRKVQLCHPPSSAWIVQRILDDFRSGGEDRSPFWINMKGRFIHIEYFALRDKAGNYLGTLEVTQDMTEKRKLDGEQRLLNYVKD